MISPTNDMQKIMKTMSIGFGDMPVVNIFYLILLAQHGKARKASDSDLLAELLDGILDQVCDGQIRILDKRLFEQNPVSEVGIGLALENLGTHGFRLVFHFSLECRHRLLASLI